MRGGVRIQNIVTDNVFSGLTAKIKFDLGKILLQGSSFLKKRNGRGQAS